MIYYLIFCIATVIVAIARVYYPAVRDSGVVIAPKIYFWFFVSCITFIIAPAAFLIVIFRPEILYQHIVEGLQERARKNKS